MNAKTLWIIVGILVVLGLGWWLYVSMRQPAPQPAVTDTGAVAGTDNQFIDNSKDGAADTSAVTITYTDVGFSPSTLTVKKGTTVTFVNTSTREMRVASDEHPSHTGYDGTDKDTHCAPGYTGPKPFDECSVGTAFSFTFDKVGTFGYHNHRNDDDHGTVIVTE